MALKYHPKPGEILLCNYNTGFIVPEMTKLRPVVVISPRLRKRDDLVAVVPLSTIRPDPIELHHCEINLKTVLPSPYEAPTMWAKCDMLATVALSRLDRFRAGKRLGSSARVYLSGQIDTPQLTSIRKAILCGLGMASLTVHL